MTGHHRLHAVRAHLLEKAGDLPVAHESYKLAARGTAGLAERRYLESRAAAVASIRVFEVNPCLADLVPTSA
jgi:predicted RNA polymerase sigma factor